MTTTAAFDHNEHIRLSRPILDADGFLLGRTDWNRELATMIAEDQGVYPLTMNHWRVIKYVRKRFNELAYPPLMRTMCRATGLKKSEVRALFGDCLTMWRIAGLPNPGEEAKSYMA